jgi:integrase/recombinase XerC
MALDVFIRYLQYEKRYSPHTLTAYEQDLTQFNQYMVSEYGVTEFRDVLAVHVRSWMVAMLQAGCKPRTIHRKVAALKSWARFMRKRGEISINPAQQVVLPKVSKRLPEQISAKSMDCLLDGEIFTDDFSGLRDRLMMALLYEAGLRRAELINLKLGDIDTMGKTMRVLGKGNKERLIPFGEPLGDLVEQYKKLREAFVGSGSEQSLLLNDRGGVMAARQVYDKVRKYLGMVSTQEKRGPHQLRHAFATQLVRGGADVNAVKELLGHRSLAATQVYLHHAVERLQSVYKQAHPRSKIYSSLNDKT